MKLGWNANPINRQRNPPLAHSREPLDPTAKAVQWLEATYSRIVLVCDEAGNCAASNSMRPRGLVMGGTEGQWDMSGPLRLTLAPELGHDIDGALWLRSERIARELPALVVILKDRLGEIIDIKVNWSVDGPPSLTFYGGECKRQPVMTVRGRDAHANLLIVPCRTTTALAVLVLRQAAFLPIDRIHLDTEAFKTAECIVDAARNQRALLRDSGGVPEAIPT